MPESAIQTYLALLAQASRLVRLPPIWPAIVSDPDDDPILHTAIAGRSDVLCSRDRAFRASAVQRICSALGIRVLDDVTLMRELREAQASDDSPR